MRIVRFINADEVICWGEEMPDGSIQRLSGSLSGGLTRTGENASVRKLLAPVEPTAILCIGLNYRDLAEVINMPLPEIPVVFSKF